MKSLQVSQLQHSFALVEVLAQISFELQAGETLALVGPSGCGKSTLLHCVAGLLTPTAGKITHDFERLACMFQQPLLLPWNTAADNLALGLKAAGMQRGQRRQLVDELAGQLGLLPEDLAKYPHELSGGMQSRVALGRALIMQPDLLLLDEPFSALDIGLKLELYQLLRSSIVREQTSVIMITHDLMEAVRLADRILMMAAQPGRIVAQFELELAQAQRDDAWIYQTTAELLQDQRVRLGFELGASQ